MDSLQVIHSCHVKQDTPAKKRGFGDPEWHDRKTFISSSGDHKLKFQQCLSHLWSGVETSKTGPALWDGMEG